MRLREARVWSLLMVAVAYLMNIIRSTSSFADGPSLQTIADGIVSQSAFDLLAWMVIFEAARSLSRETPATRRHILQTVLVGVFCAIPVRQSDAVAMLALGYFIYQQDQPVGYARRISLVLAALAFEDIWTFDNFLHVAVGKFDAQVVAAIYRGCGLAVTVHGNVVQHGVDQFGIMVLGPCASSYMLAGTGVAFLVTGLFRRATFGRFWFVWLCGSLLASVVLTEMRLSLMAADLSSYEWWHWGLVNPSIRSPRQRRRWLFRCWRPGRECLARFGRRADEMSVGGMKNSLRATFALLMLMAVLTQTVVIRRTIEGRPGASSIPAATASIGLADVGSASGSRLDLIAPTCSDRLRIDILDLDGRVGDETPDQSEPGRLVVYVYLGSAQEHIEATALRARWLLAEFLFRVGVRPSKPGTEIYRVTIPEQCAALVGLDWAALSPW